MLDACLDASPLSLLMLDALFKVPHSLLAFNFQDLEWLIIGEGPTNRIVGKELLLSSLGLHFQRLAVPS